MDLLARTCGDAARGAWEGGARAGREVSAGLAPRALGQSPSRQGEDRPQSPSPGWTVGFGCGHGGGGGEVGINDGQADGTRAAAALHSVLSAPRRRRHQRRRRRRGICEAERDTATAHQERASRELKPQDGNVERPPTLWKAQQAGRRTERWFASSAAEDTPRAADQAQVRT